MALPFNPATLMQTALGNKFSPTSALGGALAGAQYGDYRESLGRQYRTDDLQHQSAQNDYNNALLDNPVKEAKRGVDMGLMGIQQGQIDDGTMKQGMDAEIASKVQKAISEKTDNEKKKLAAQADAWEQLDMDIQSGNVQPADIEGWRSKVKQYDALGIKLPPVFSPQVAAQIRQRAKIAPYTRQFAQEVALSNSRLSQGAAIATERNATDLEIARIGARSRENVANSRPEPNVNALETAKRKLQEDPNSLNEGDIALLEQEMMKNNPEVAKNIIDKFAQVRALQETNPEAAAKLLKQAKAYREEMYAQFGLGKLLKKLDRGTTPEESKPTASSQETKVLRSGSTAIKVGTDANGKPIWKIQEAPK